MRKLHEITADLKTILETKFQTVRTAAFSSADQFLTDLSAILPEQMPCVFIVFDQCAFLENNTVFEVKFKLMLIDRFSVLNSGRVSSFLENYETLITLFPPDGQMVNSVFLLPGICSSGGNDDRHAVLSFTLTASQASS